MKSRKAISTPIVFSVAAVIGVITGAIAFYAVPPSSSLAGNPASNQTSSTNKTTSQTASVATAAARGGAVILALAPSNRFLGPGFSQDFSLSLIPAGQPQGRYSLSAFGLAPGLTVTIRPNSIDLSVASQLVDVAIQASAQLAPGTYQIGISARGSGSSFNQTFALLVVPRLVQIVGGTFTPSNVTLSAGGEVVWVSLDGLVNDAQVLHQVKLSVGAASSPILHQYESWSYTFTTPGWYSYYDVLNPSMTGTVVVTP